MKDSRSALPGACTLGHLIFLLQGHYIDVASDVELRAGASCFSRVYRVPGSCVGLEQCVHFMSLLQQDPFSAQSLIWQSLCSANIFDSTVCCPQLKNQEPNDQPSNDNQRGTTESGRPSQYSAPTRPLYPPYCGSATQLFNRVVGGQAATPGAWPWIANLGYMVSRNQAAFRCGGALISSRHILTAAHCVYGSNNLRFVRLGEYDIQSQNDGANPIDVQIQQSIIHPRYNPNVIQNDIAILKLSRDVEFTDAIHPICLPVANDIKNKNFVGKNPFVAGWGSTYFNGPPSNILLEAQIPVVGTEKCRASYSRVKNVLVDDRNLCAGLDGGGKDSCQGDSGGPLMYPVNSSFYIIGVVSNGYKCGLPGYPGVYARVSAYLDFILSNMN
ncbi:hypothetical protein QAD02_003745 [Eretmocerus hayati]|uniref:Uncharacterized protein n=1 Tax=Eretmocerus hayati TaxID=131215 RepID=A0ACC2NMX8_9HYME|nr:hypothetical protein QAD02_003745 [Eretmocerus hayati]